MAGAELATPNRDYAVVTLEWFWWAGDQERMRDQAC